MTFDESLLKTRFISYLKDMDDVKEKYIHQSFLCYNISLFSLFNFLRRSVLEYSEKNFIDKHISSERKKGNAVMGYRRLVFSLDSNFNRTLVSPKLKSGDVFSFIKVR